MRRLRFAALLCAVALLLAMPSGAAAAPTFIGEVGSFGTTPAHFNGAEGIVADGMGNIYVLDINNGRVQKFGAGLNYLTSWDVPGIVEIGIAVDRQGFVYVASWGTPHKVIKYSPTGTIVQEFTSPSQIDIAGCAVDADGYVYAVDRSAKRVRKYKPDGTYVGGSPYAFNDPYGVVVGKTGVAYVTDLGAQDTVKLVDLNGQYVGTWDGSASGSPFDGVEYPGVDLLGNVLIADTTDNHIDVFSPTGGFLGTFGSFGATPGAFNIPTQATADGSGIYVMDRNNNRVQKFAFSSPKSATRIGGANRYDVSANLVSARWPGLAGIKHVIVVCGEDRANADPLAAAGLAGVWDAPVLLTTTSKLTVGTENMLKAIRSANGPIAIHVIGGSRSIPRAVYNRIATTNPGGTIERIDGSDRYALSAAIANKMASELAAKGEAVPGVLIMNAENPKAFYDDLAASPIAARRHLPMLAVRAKSVPGAVAVALSSTFAGKPRYAVSGTGYLPGGVYAATGCSERLATSGDRITAAVQIASAARAKAWLTYANTGIANKLPDALTGGSFMGLSDGVLLYTNTSPLASGTSGFVSGNKYGTAAGWVFGGPKSVGDPTVASFTSVLNTP